MFFKPAHGLGVLHAHPTEVGIAVGDGGGFELSSAESGSDSSAFGPDAVPQTSDKLSDVGEPTEEPVPHTIFTRLERVQAISEILGFSPNSTWAGAGESRIRLLATRSVLSHRFAASQAPAFGLVAEVVKGALGGSALMHMDIRGKFEAAQVLLIRWATLPCTRKLRDGSKICGEMQRDLLQERY